MIKKLINFQSISLFTLCITIFILVIIPFLLLIGFTLTGWDLTVPGSLKFNGLDNYKQILSDHQIWSAAIKTLIATFVPTIIQVIFGVSFALILWEMVIGKDVFRTVLLIPMVIPPTIAGLIWKLLYYPKIGGISFMLEKMGFGTMELLSNPKYAFWAILVVSTWQMIPFVMLLSLAALESLSNDIFEAAKIDGVTYTQKIKYIVLPLIKDTVITAFLFRIIENVKIFPYVFSMTQGGPGTSTQDLTFYTYTEGFRYYKFGYSSTIAVFTLLIVAIISIGALKLRYQASREVTE